MSPLRLAGMELVALGPNRDRLRVAAAAEPTVSPPPLLAQPGAPLVGRPWRSLSMTRVVDGGEVERARDAVLSWQILRDSGIGVLCDRDHVEVGATVVQRLPRIGPGVLAPCRVVEVIDEPDRIGFTYAALPGHPLAGAEAFVVERIDGQVAARVTSISRPEAWAARQAVPVLRRFQQLAANAYVRSLARAAGAPA